MRYMLLMNHGSAPGVPPMSEWSPEDMKAHGAAMMAIDEELVAGGEFVGGEALVGPDGSKIVRHDGVGAPVVTDGPFPGVEGVPGRVLDCRRRERGAGDRDRRPDVGRARPGRRADRQAIEVRPVMSRPAAPEA